VHGPEPLHGLRVVARSDAIDAAIADGRIASGAIVIRIAADDAFVIGASSVTLDDPAAIVEPESAFVGWWLTPDQLADIAHHIEWPVPRPIAGTAQLAQGLIAGIPMKLWFADATDAGEAGTRVMLIVSRGLAHEAGERLFGVRA
jgi:hypothetical protein